MRAIYQEIKEDVELEKRITDWWGTTVDEPKARARAAKATINTYDIIRNRQQMLFPLQSL